MGDLLIQVDLLNQTSPLKAESGLQPVADKEIGD